MGSAEWRGSFVALLGLGLDLDSIAGTSPTISGERIGLDRA